MYLCGTASINRLEMAVSDALADALADAAATNHFKTFTESMYALFSLVEIGLSFLKCVLK